MPAYGPPSELGARPASKRAGRRVRSPGYSNYSWTTFQKAIRRLKNVLGDELRRERLARDLSQEQVAARARISRNYVSLLELNQKSPTVAVLLRICKAIGVKASKVIARVED